MRQASLMKTVPELFLWARVPTGNPGSVIVWIFGNAHETLSIFKKACEWDHCGTAQVLDSQGH